MNKHLKQNYRIETPNNEIVYTEPGKNGENDMKIFSKFPKIPWAHSLYYIATCLRLKGMVEDRNYPPKEGKYGSGMLVAFCSEAILNKQISIKDLCKKYKIPERE